MRKHEDSRTRAHNYKPSPIQRYQNLSSDAAWANSSGQPLPDKSVTDGQTDRSLDIFCSPGGVRSLSPTKLGTVIEDLEHVLAFQNVLEVRRTVSLLV